MQTFILIISAFFVLLLIAFIINRLGESEPVERPEKPNVRLQRHPAPSIRDAPSENAAITKSKLETGMVNVSVKQLEKYMQGASIGRDSMDLMTEAILNGKRSVMIRESTLREIESKWKQHVERELAMDQIFTRRANSQALEKGGKLEEALESYRESIIFAITSHHIQPNTYGFDLNRFRILCNKLKRKEDYENLIAKYKIPV